jgi:hypothetical protein
MPETSPRIRKISHWAGVALASPMLAIGLYLVYEYLRGGFPATVTIRDAVIVIGFVLLSTAAIYLAMRWAGYLLAQAIGAVRNIGKGNGTSAGSHPSRPE